jgi:hypothetical protein
MQVAGVREVFLRPRATEPESADVLSDALLWFGVRNPGATPARLHVASLAPDSQVLQSTLLLSKFLKFDSRRTDTATKQQRTPKLTRN